MPDLDAIRKRDREAECAEAPCHQTAADRRALLAYIDKREGQWRRSTAVLVDVHEEEMRRIAEEVTEEVLGPTWEGITPSGEPITVLDASVTNGGVCPYCGMTTWVDDHCALPWCEGFREVLQ